LIVQTLLSVVSIEAAWSSSGAAVSVLYCTSLLYTKSLIVPPQVSLMLPGTKPV